MRREWSFQHSASFLLLVRSVLAQNEFSLCKDPAMFTPMQTIELECGNVTEVACWNIIGFKWDKDTDICSTEFWTRATPDMVTGCESVGGVPKETQTCGSHEEVILGYLNDSNISTEVALTKEACGALLTGETLGLEGSFYSFIHATTVCCGGQPHLGACDPDEQAICADPGFYTPDRFLHMRCYGVDQETCENELPGFSWEIDQTGGHEVCIGPQSGQTDCEENMGFTSPKLTCAELNTIYTLLEARYELSLETQEGCDAFYSNVSEEFGEMDEVNPLLTNYFLNYVGAPLCCDGMATVCTFEDPYSVCANPDDFEAENVARLECHGVTVDECLELDGFEFDSDESTCLTRLFMEANEGYEDACMDIGGKPVATATCAESQALLTTYFTRLNLNAPYTNDTCQRLLSEVNVPFTALYWFEHLPTACCGGLGSACEFEPVELCADPDQFTPDAPTRIRCSGVSDEMCVALGSNGFEINEIEGHNVCLTRLFETIPDSAETDCMNIGGIPQVEASCELTRTIATYVLGEHSVFNLTSSGQCESAVDSLDDDDLYAVYLFRHIPTACCGGEQNSICTFDDVDDSCENQALFYAAPDFDVCDNLLTTNLTNSACVSDCSASVQRLVDDLECCTMDWIEIAYRGLDMTPVAIFDRLLQTCVTNSTIMATCDDVETTTVITPTALPVSSDDSGPASTTAASAVVVLAGITVAMLGQR